MLCSAAGTYPTPGASNSSSAAATATIIDGNVMYPTLFWCDVTVTMTRCITSQYHYANTRALTMKGEPQVTMALGELYQASAKSSVGDLPRTDSQSLPHAAGMGSGSSYGPRSCIVDLHIPAGKATGNQQIPGRIMSIHVHTEIAVYRM